MKEPTLESLTKKKREYEPPRFMSVSVAANQILQIIENKLKEDKSFALDEECKCVGVARVGSSTQQISVCSLKEMKEKNLGAPLHSLVIPAPELHPIEEEYLRQFVDNA